MYLSRLCGRAHIHDGYATYAQVDVVAPILLVLLRLLQGLAVAGEMGTSVTFLVEQAGDKRRGQIGSAAL
ncbi:hypothetical protein PQQ86_32530 [Paraburkholderia sediminicola]|uniref:hypothetical protein n=1 Tax=Paraburkholderia sediminicola TaxID=458836 RepID=UPI0038BE0037